jgi:hypothetical protein
LAHEAAQLQLGLQNFPATSIPHFDRIAGNMLVDLVLKVSEFRNSGLVHLDDDITRD